ncbi:MAG: CoA-transferase subunit beta [Acidimicrobiia bacterium]
MSGWTSEELMAVTASRLLRDGTVVFAGVGMPILAAMLAQKRQAPHLTIALEGGIIGPRIAPGRLPISTNEMRAARQAPYLTDIGDVFLFAQRGFFDYGFLGAAQVDEFGNINSSVIGDGKPPKVRLPGSGGANDIASLCSEILIVTKHERRRFVKKVDFVTSPGYLRGGETRRRAGLIFGRLTAVITDLAQLDFDPRERRMRLCALQPGVSEEEVKDQTDFDLAVVDQPKVLEAPTDRELEILRSVDTSGAILR